MIKFLLQRPIAVLMAFTACFIVGLVTYFTIPVSLLPDIAIPEITVQVSGQNTSARELENTVVKTIRQQLMQVASLRDIHSETRDGAAIIRLNFDFGTNTDLAFIEVNEKIDAAMNYLPREVERPRVIKASATDIPVFCLNLTLKSDSAYSEINEGSFLDLCQFAETVIKRRIEQLPEVAMVDVTGILKRQLQIVPDMKLLKMSEITLDDLEAALTSNNIEPGSMTVRDGYYEYNIKFSTLLRTPEDVENIYIRKNNHIFQPDGIAGLYHLEPETKPVVGFPFHLYRRHPFLRGYQEPGSDRVKYGGEPDHQFPFFLPLQDVAEYHLHLRVDPGFGYDDRQFDHRNGKHYPIQDTRRLAGRGLQ